MNRSQLQIGIILFGVIVLAMVAAYCWHKASFANLHVVLAEEEDLDLFPELGRRIRICLNVMMGVIVILGFTTSFLLLISSKNQNRELLSSSDIMADRDATHNAQEAHQKPNKPHHPTPRGHLFP